MFSGHYTPSINCCKNITLQRQKITELEIKLLYCICSNVQIDYAKGFVLEQEHGSTLLPWHWHILSTPIEAGRGIRAKTCGLDDVFPPDDLDFSLYTQFIIPYISCITTAF